MDEAVPRVPPSPDARSGARPPRLPRRRPSGQDNGSDEPDPAPASPPTEAPPPDPLAEALDRQAVIERGEPADEGSSRIVKALRAYRVEPPPPPSG